MKTTLINNQTGIRINLPKLRRLTNKLADCLVQADPDTEWSEVSVLLTDDDGIIPANREYFGKNRPTDVISFRCEPVPGEGGTTGDLIVNVECALREGPAHDGPDAELALYIAHGFDHLSGADDNTPQKRAAMRRTEKRWLAALQSEIKNLILK
ncbi:rRNA maturation RNase YbeY [Tichowtungia aerotolerans]|uniref:Endoribonuclease YbeY n=1 Tax=Tichowtungia aerotolerans TaxID=2697043 RepID=A0A6P1M747_9BACT|nr:rRNA maturation RNase YbeY [Tichowtungia aerotolerans]QHI68853.1 rRNA maturation RNase YbeY [Tichowtungia aerotolerans]